MKRRLNTGFSDIRVSSVKICGSSHSSQKALLSRVTAAGVASPLGWFSARTFTPVSRSLDPNRLMHKVHNRHTANSLQPLTQQLLNAKNCRHEKCAAYV
jgi:hypothetical protein